MLLEGKKGLIYGVRNERSIAWGCAVALAREGATLAFSVYSEREEKDAQRLSQSLPEGCSATEVIEILRALVLSPKASHEELARQLTARGLRITPGQVSHVTTHYAHKKKRRR